MDVGSTARPEPTTTEGSGDNITVKAESEGPPLGTLDPETGGPPPGTLHPETEGRPHGARRRPALSDRLPMPLLFPLLVYGAAWALIVTAWQVANAIYRVPWPWGRYFLYHDGSSYNWLAIHGYAGYAGHRIVPPSPSQAAYFPVLPLLIKTVSNMTRHQYLPAETIVQVVAGALAAVAVWALAAKIGDHRLADRTVVLFCAFPGAMTFGMLYPEPLGSALAACCLLAALNRKWLLSGLLALAASAVHPALIVLAPTLAITSAHAIVTRRDWQSLIAPLLAPLGMAGYFGLLAGGFHDYLFWFHFRERGWGGRLSWAVHELRVVTWTDPGTSKYALFNVIVIVMAIVLVVGIGAMIAARMPLPVSLYTVLAVLAFAMAESTGPTPRFAWTALGIFPGLSARLPRWLFWPLVAACAGALVFLYGWWPRQGNAFAP
jgi:hypothetical protein